MYIVLYSLPLILMSLEQSYQTSFAHERQEELFFSSYFKVSLMIYKKKIPPR